MLIGHEKVRIYLEALLAARAGARNLLFLGTEGVGKYTLARMFARARLCEKKSALQDEACDCGSCKAYARSLHPDVIVLDCRTLEGGVEDMRALKERLAYTPLGGSRVVILDNAHEMTRESGNALLKTLEEPRSDTTFLVVAHRDTLPATVRSRFEIIRMGLVDPRRLREETKNLKEEEGELLVYVAQGRPGHFLRLQKDDRAVHRARTYSSHLTTFLRGSVYQRMRYFDTVKEEDRKEELGLWPAMLMDWLAIMEGAPRFYPAIYQRDMKQAEFSSVLLLKALTTLITIQGLKSRYTLNTSLLEEQLTLI